MANRIFSRDDGVTMVPSLSEKLSDTKSTTQAVAKLFAHGVELDFEEFNAAFGYSRVPLPTVCFRKKKYWIPDLNKMVATQSGEASAQDRPLTKALTETTINPLVGQRVKSPFVTNLLFASHMSVASMPVIGEHVINKFVIVPAVFYVGFVLEACANAFGPGPRILSNVAIPAAMLLEDRKFAKFTQLVFKPVQGNATNDHSWTLYSYNSGDAEVEDSWKANAMGSATMSPTDRDTAPPQHETPLQIQQRARQQQVVLV